MFGSIYGIIAGIVSIVVGSMTGLVSIAGGLLEDVARATGFEEGVFLPAGRGASILVLGGIAVVLISLTIALAINPLKLTGSRSSSETDGAGSDADGPGGSFARFSSAHPDPGPAPAWLDSLREVADKGELGKVVLLSERSGRQAICISPCSGSEARRGAPTCDQAHELIWTAVRAVEPQARVVPVSCKAEGDHACVFEVRTGGAPP